MKKLIYLMMCLVMSLASSACNTDNDEPQMEQPGESETTPDDIDLGKTLIVYYSYTNNVHTIVNNLQSKIEADVVRVEPAEKGLDYAANNYAIGSALIAAIRNNPNDANSYPAIDPVNVDLSQYSTIIVGTPLWWSNMAAPMQTFLFQHGAEMAGKNVGLIVSSGSSGISGVEADAKRLIPDGKFLTPSLWIRSSQTNNSSSLINNWLNTIRDNQ